MCAGGDWQIPVKFRIILDDNDKLITEKLMDDYFEEGIDFDDFINIIFENKPPKKLEEFIEELY